MSDSVVACKRKESELQKQLEEQDRELKRLKSCEDEKAWMILARFPRESHYSEFSVNVMPYGPQKDLLSRLVMQTVAPHRRQLRSPHFCAAPQLEIICMRSAYNVQTIHGSIYVV